MVTQMCLGGIERTIRATRVFILYISVVYHLSENLLLPALT